MILTGENKEEEKKQTIQEAYNLSWDRFKNTHMINPKNFKKTQKAFFCGFQSAIDLAKSNLLK